MAKQNLPDGITLITTSDKHFGDIISLAWSPNGEFVATGSRDETIKIWDGKNAKFVKTNTGHVEAITCIAWSHDSNFLASGSRNVRILNFKTGEHHKTILERYSPLQSLAWSPDGSRLASGSHGRVILWDPRTGDLKRELQGFPGLASSIAWSHDSKVIASSSLTQVCLWDIFNGKILRKLAGHSQNVISIAWSPDGQILATGSEDTTISLWDTKSWRHIGILEGHTAPVNQLSFSHDGNILASEANDVRIWRCDTWDTLATINTSVSSKITTSGWSSGTIGFRPKTSILATLGKAPAAMSLWKIDFKKLSEVKPITASIRYTNAKVVLVGDTGVGKSGLGLVLADPPFRATDSTHSRRVWTFDISDVQVDDKTIETREILLYSGPRFLDQSLSYT
jgi:WD40 repeat protein